MALRVAHITLDCEDPIAVSRFWSAAMGLTVADGASPGFAWARHADDENAPKWFFIEVPEGKTVKNRLHLDLEADDRQAEVARLLVLGASLVEDHDQHGHRWTTLCDVEGNEFCVSDQLS